MWKTWDSDRKLLVMLFAAAAIGLAITYRDALAQTAGGTIAAVQAGVHRFLKSSPGEETPANDGAGFAERFSSEDGFSGRPEGVGVDGRMRMAYIDQRGCRRFIYGCQGIRDCQR